MIIPNHAVDQNPTALAANPIGTGPYKLVRWDRNNQVVLQAKPKYFLGRPRIARVIFRTLPDPSSRLAALKTGDVDVITNLPPDNIRNATSTHRARAASVPSARIAAVWLNTLENPALAKRQVRTALNYAVNTGAIVKRVMSNYALRVPTIVAPYFEGYNRRLKPFPYNPTRARRLLADAGYSRGLTLTLMVPHGRYLLGEDTLQAVAGYLANVGVKVNINQVEFGVFAEATRVRKIPDGFFAAWGNALFNPIDMLEATVVSGTNGFSWYRNARVDALTKQAEATLNQKKRVALLQRIQTILRGDPPFIFLYAYKDLYGVSNRLKWKPRSDELIYMYGASLAKGR
jgi:peptide/nickel transport system substrate-binding protein